MKQDPSPRSWLNRDVFGFGLTSLLSDVSHEMATAVLPAFLASIGAPAAALGIIEGVSDGLSSAAKLWSGWFTDRTGTRKPIAVIGYVMTASSQAVFAVAGWWPIVLAGRAFGWLGRGARGPVRDAMMADCVEPANYGKAFGFERAMDTAGAIVGPLLAFVLLPRIGFRGLLWLSIVPGLLAVASIWLLTTNRAGRPGAKHGILIGLRALPVSYREFLGGVFVFGLGDFAHTLLILRVTDVLAPSMGRTAAASLAVLGYALHNVVGAAASYIFGGLADRTRKLPLLALGYLLAAAAFAGLGVAGDHGKVVFALFVASGVYIGIQEVLEKAVGAELLPTAMRGTGFGALATANGIGDLFSSSVAGLLWTAVSPAAAFTCAAVLTMAGSAVMWWISARERQA